MPPRPSRSISRSPTPSSASLNIAVLDTNAASGRATIEALQQAGFKKLSIVRKAPGTDVDIVVVSGSNASQLIDGLRSDPIHPNRCVIAMCHSDCAAVACIAAGADETVLSSTGSELLQRRVLQGFEISRKHNSFAKLTRFQEVLLKTRELIAQRGDGVDVVREILLLAASALSFERASMMAHIESSSTAFVIAATDDPTLSQFEVAISDYPEVGEAISSGQALLIDNVAKHPVTQRISSDLGKHGVAAIAVFPVAWKGRSMGALLFRKSLPGVSYLEEHAQAFATLLAAQLAAQLSDSSRFEGMRDQTRRLDRHGYDEARRAQALESLHDYFEASPEGILVVDQAGKLIFVNRRAEAMLGFARDALLGTIALDLVPKEQHSDVLAVMNSIFEGDSMIPIDLQILTTARKYITVVLTASGVLSKHAAVIFSIRDVTHQRSLEAQLKHSNQFLANLINSAVDAIIAVDMRGIVIVFNEGAETLFGYQSSEVVGRMPVGKLYPDKVPQQVMRMLRSAEHGGIGRLEQNRRSVLVRGGDAVPVNMTASIIYESGKEVATVGIFSDLRDRIRMEQRLFQAQEKLAAQEQRSMLAELAGAAAHELNQPLTSIIGYAQLMQRTSELSERHARYMDTIVDEADRMAEIVKKIGRITHYETVPYVGSTNIVDLNKSLEVSESMVMPVLPPSDFEDEATLSLSLEGIAEALDEKESAGISVPISKDEDPIR